MMESFKKIFEKLNEIKESSFHRILSFFRLAKSDSSTTDSEEVEILDNTEYLDGYYYDENVYYNNGYALDTTNNYLENQRVRFL